MKPEENAVHLTVPEKDIYYISWNLDACEGLGFLQTDDAKNGKVTVFTPLELMDDLYSFIDGLRNEGIAVTVDSVGKIEKTKREDNDDK